MTRWDVLNAYVDGELPLEEAEAVRERAAHDPDLQARITTLSRLKACVSLAGEATSEAAIATRRRSRLIPNAAAAAAVAVGTVAVLLNGEEPQPPDSIATAIAVYRHWPAAAADGAAPSQTHAGVRLGATSPPDLRAAHLHLVFVAPIGHPESVLFGYEGIHGCRVALWIARDGDEARESTLDMATDIQAVRWAVRRRGFALLARGMEKARFEVLAAAVERLTREHDPEGARVALGQSAEIGRPCAS